jgi:hypothetical protein
MKTVAFFIRHFGERGTEVAVYSYAHYNETILGNKSIILAFHKETYDMIYYSCGVRFIQDSFNRFSARFPIIQVRDFSEVDALLEKLNVDAFYMLTHGAIGHDGYPFAIPATAHSIIHCVFTTQEPHGSVYIPISDHLNEKYGTTYPVLPHIVDVADTREDMREELGIPKDAVVFGRYGGEETFDIGIARQAVIDTASAHSNIYFIFMNTPAFCNLPNVKFLPRSLDDVVKRKFINTSDAFLHARSGGETFGLAIAEFAVCEKPIFACTSFIDDAHFKILGDKIVPYTTLDELNTKLSEFYVGKYDMKNNGYMAYSPERVMKTFERFLPDEKRITESRANDNNGHTPVLGYNLDPLLCGNVA